MLACVTLARAAGKAARWTGRGLAVDVASIKSLREKTGAPIGDVKAALEAAGGDADGAFDELRKRGLAASRKKAGRTASEGVVAVAAADDKSAAAVVELNSETDFVARNDAFARLARTLAEHALALAPDGHTGPIDDEAMRRSTVSALGGQTVDDAVVEVAAAVRENVQFRRAWAIRPSAGSAVATYVHGAIAPGMGRIASVVALAPAGSGEGSAAAGDVAELGRKLAMHACAANPLYLSEADMPEDARAAERAILVEKSIADGKAPDRAEKIADKGLKKFVEESCMLSQKFVMDDKRTIASVVKSEAKGWALTSFARLEVGEGITKESTDFAAEVLKTIEGAN